jgi:outer membrane protein assembly factor BamB
LVYVGSFDKYLYAVDARTGQEKWRFKTPGLVESSPAVAKGVVYFEDWLSNIYAVNASTGVEKWKRYMNGGTASAIIKYGLVFIGGTANKVLYALNSKTGKTIWTYHTPGYPFASPAIAYGLVYLGVSPPSYPGEDFLAVDIRTGKLLWSVITEAPLPDAPKRGANTSPVVAGQTVYFGASDGKLYAVKALPTILP